MVIDACCAQCLLDKRLNDCPPSATPQAVAAYQRSVREIVARGARLSGPELDYEITEAARRHFGAVRDYGPVKRRFNGLMLAIEEELWADIEGADDPLRRAVQYAMTGNYIDFSALSDVNEGDLRRLLGDAGANPVDGNALEAFREEVASARALAFLTDNCGEIVLDKLLIRALRAVNPALEVTAVVRGKPVVNDATLEDAAQVRLDEAAQRVIGNGCGIAGHPMDRISAQARRILETADVLVSKGQANYESLYGCGLNVFYIFMCKCRLFMERFGVPQFSGILTREGDA